MIALRLVLNTGSRMMFTFLPEFSRGTGLTIDQLGRLLSIRDLSGLIAPYIGRTSDRTGTRRTMLIGGTLAGIGALLMTLGALGVIVGLMLWGLGRISYHVSMNAWVGNEVAYERRGRATGQVEMTWAGAALVGIPAMGLLIERISWRAAPAVLASLALPLVFLLSKRLAPPAEARSEARNRPNMTFSGWAVMATFTLLNGSAQFLVFSHGIWLEGTYNFNPSQIGFAIIGVGAAELLSSFGSSRLTDRLGKRNSVAIGAAVLTFGLIGLAMVEEPPLGIGLGLLILSFLGFEFGIVSAIPLIAELDPLARAEVIGRSVGLSILARSAGSLTASFLIANQGFRLVMALAATLAGLTTILSLVVVREPETSNLAG